MSSQRFGLLVLVVIGLVFGLSAVSAQETSGRQLSPNTPITGTLDADNLAQVYTLTAEPNEQVTLTAASADTALALLITDSTGQTIAQAAAASGETDVSLAGEVLPTGGLYYVTVLPASGVPTESTQFELTLTIDSATGYQPSGQLLTATGMQIRLTWNSTANLDLEVRDPIGGSLFFNTPTVASGGQFGVNANSVCNQVTANSPTEEASWVAGAIPTGSYEILVYYQPLQDCPTAEPANLSIEVTLDGTASAPVTGTLLPNQVFLLSFSVGADGTATTVNSGVKVDPPVAPDLSGTTPTSLVAGSPVAGDITNRQPLQVYSFAGQAGQVISVEMNATSGSLDTLLLLLDPNGNQAAFNDDRERGNTDAALQNFSLVLNGTYTVVATRYGQILGGTEGEYSLLLSGIGDQVAAATLIPNLPGLPRGSVEVSLQWSTGVDLQLLVRDPVGDAVFDDSPQIPSGGTLAANGNVNCTPAVGEPVSYIYWPEGRLPTAGPYEIEVQHQNLCNDNSPTTFTLNVIANGQLVLSRTQTIRFGERYVTSYNIGVDGTVAAGEGGIFGTVQRPDATTIDFAAQIENAQVLTSDQTATGSIRLNRKFDLYTFTGQAGQTVNISMERLTGTLDPVLFLIDPNGVQIAQNDDAARDTTNSLISGFTLSEDGQYIIIATHFGGTFGVTAGDYRLTLRLS
ncbi:MAG: PPC domain-containing protein [Anaerolineae bacterium]|nr:PPC domain-containing protein [Anaerolineae bacterium]